MQLLVLFGLPGAGKTFVSNILKTNFGFFVYEADKDMQQALKDAIEKEQVTEQLRDIFFTNLIKRVQQLSFDHKKIVVSQTFIKEKYREQFLKSFPKAKFIFIQAEATIRENRLITRKEWSLSLDQWRKMASLFEKPQVKHTVITNNEKGTNVLRQQLEVLLTTIDNQ